MTDLADRYGTSSGARRWIAGVVGSAVALVVLAFVVWSFVAQADPEVQSRLTSYDVQGPHEATADVTVVRASEDVVATCPVEALAADHSVVGVTTETIDSGPTTQTLRVSVRTEREAVTVVLEGCTAPGQSRPR